MALDINAYGKIISSSEGDQLFGKVISSYQLNSKDLLAYCQNAGQLVMFAEENAELFVAGTGRIMLSAGVKEPSPDLVFHVYSVSKVNELLTLGNEDVTVVEVRSDVIDLKNGEFILEFAEYCPPICV